MLLAGPALAEETERIWLEVARPYNGWVELGLNSLLEVRGAAGRFERNVLDVMIIVDISRSTKHGSGVDVNGDGHVGGVGWGSRRDLGSYLRHPQTSSDPGDSILQAEVEAVRRLLENIDLSETRVGIVSLRETAQLCSSLGNDQDEHLNALDALLHGASDGRTYMAEAIRVATRELVESAIAHPGRDRGIILLSDGKPTVPSPDERAAREAVEAARAAGDAGVRIYSVGLGVAQKESYALREIAAVSNGLFTTLAEPGEIIEALPRFDLLGLADISVTNTTTRREARAIKVWADGSFDGFVSLRPGKNRIEIKARAPDGSEVSFIRWVYFKEREPRTARERDLETRKLERLRNVLRERSLEVEIAREVETARSTVRSLEVEPEN
jgi:Mg-chelatase subunit ChlD